MAAAYLVVSYDVSDPEGFEPYTAGVIPLLAKHGAEVLVADYETEPLEGSDGATTIVLKFESEEAARGFYDDPDYAPVRQIRLDNTSNGRMVLVKEFVMPTG